MGASRVRIVASDGRDPLVVVRAVAAAVRSSGSPLLPPAPSPVSLVGCVSVTMTPFATSTERTLGREPIERGRGQEKGVMKEQGHLE